MISALWNFLNSKFFLLVFGFLLTGVVGAYLTDRLQNRAWRERLLIETARQDFEWERAKRFELLRRRLDKGEAVLDSISDLAHRRFFRLQKVHENLADGDEASVARAWAAYMPTVEEWNVKLIGNQERLERLVDAKAAALLNNYETDGAITDPQSLHGHFFLAHRAILALVECDGCPERAQLREQAERRIRALDLFSDAFVEMISERFVDRTLELEEFSGPVPTLLTKLDPSSGRSAWEFR